MSVYDSCEAQTREALVQQLTVVPDSLAEEIQKDGIQVRNSAQPGAAFENRD